MQRGGRRTTGRPALKHMNWIQLQESDLHCILSKSQIDLLKAEALKNGDASICAKAMELAVSRVRAEIAASGTNMLDENYGKIPPELKECALRLAAEILQSRIPTLEFGKIQAAALETAKQTLARVSEGKLPVSRPRNGVRTARKFSMCHGGQSRRLGRASTEGC